VIAFVKRLWAAAPVATVILLLALAFGGFFAARTVAFWVYWNDPAHRSQAVAAWMTPGYVAHSWQVPRELVLEAIDAPRNPEGPMSLEIEAAIADFRAGAAPPPAGEARP
jgi:hypothetical protein